MTAFEIIDAVKKLVVQCDSFEDKIMCNWCPYQKFCVHFQKVSDTND